MGKTFATAGAALGGTAVLAGAFGAHALQGRLDSHALEIFETAVRWQIVHALALLVVAGGLAFPDRLPRGPLRAAGATFLAGTLLFSGSLYVIALTGVKGWGAVTPVGGLGLVAGWVSLCVATLKTRPSPSS